MFGICHQNSPDGLFGACWLKSFIPSCNKKLQMQQLLFDLSRIPPCQPRIHPNPCYHKWPAAQARSQESFLWLDLDRVGHRVIPTYQFQFPALDHSTNALPNKSVFQPPGSQHPSIVAAGYLCSSGWRCLDYSVSNDCHL